ncbi:urease accessory protein UreF [Marinibactrum halimedae]|uniref:Urease accessory protein UreF n=1 Tax=Marinibactrum halimedae TaxID=1444977 RepID=A0AA37T6I3_9GAMM|nr:urease accessory UreF family protein [Marinibactrum halimedae]MCD9460842.1 urease accessory protein UreF [Marinibactrum halimedae]GLS26694.1 urease accessory protein UreF [Marinibactrum halimedae]
MYSEEKSSLHRLLSLLHLSSSALPVGSFAYSQGLEYALDSGWCNNSSEVHDWIVMNLRFGLGHLDLPIYLRLFSAWKKKDLDSIKRWNAILLSFRETQELYWEDVNVGSAYARWHIGQDAERKPDVAVCALPTVVCMHALGAVYSELEPDWAMLGFIWSWCENQIACASKVLPMGQTEGQRMLQTLIPIMIEVGEQSCDVDDDNIGSGLMGMALASALHEQQYSRLFRS